MGNSQAKEHKKAVGEALGSVDTPASQLYPLAVQEKNLETKVELFTRAAKAYAEEGDTASSAMSYLRAGETNVQLKEFTDASDCYIEAMMAYSLDGIKNFTKFEECIEKSMEYAQRSSYKTRQKSCLDKIGQSILRMISSDKTGEVISLLLKSNMINLYLKGDHYLNGLKAMIERFKNGEFKNYNIWSQIFESATDFYIAQFALDGSLDDDITTYACISVLCSYIYQYDVKMGVIKPPSPKNIKKIKKSNNNSPSNSPRNQKDGKGKKEEEEYKLGDDDDGDDDEDNVEEETQISTPEELQKKFCQVNAYKLSSYQCIYNIMTAADCGDIESLEEQFHELYFVRRKNKGKLIEFIWEEIYKLKFESWIKDGKVKFIKKWEESEANQNINDNGNDDIDSDGNKKEKRDVIDDLM